MRFWIKHVACRLAEHEFEVLPQLTRALDGAGAVEGLNFQLLIRRDLVQLTKFIARTDGDFPYTALGDLHGFSDGINPTTRIESSLGYRWFEVRWFYDLTTIGRTPITFAEPVFKLGHGYRVHPLIVRTRLEARHALHLVRP